MLLTACGGGGGGGTGASAPVLPTAAPPAPGTSSAYTCPSSATSFGVTGASSASASAMHRMYGGRTSAHGDDRALIVTYASDSNAIVRQTQGRSLSFDRIGRSARFVPVGSDNPAALAAKLRALPGVVSVTAAHRLYPQTRSATFTNDPYFDGAKGTSAPLYQTASTGGQWDMHAIGLEHAFSYSLGSTGVRLAVIDTGEDVNHHEIAGADVVSTKCFITDSTGRTQSTGPFVSDADGHGTDVTGIAAAASNNGYGFTGAAGHVGLMLYRVFPTPNDDCNDPTSTDTQCSAWDIDIASAINDAVSNGANVINLSLGDSGAGCTSGSDPDSIEGNAIANAVAHNVIVVAATGNAGKSAVGPPGCVTSVIAAGSSAYNDGQPNGSGFSGSRKEYVASYSNTGAVNTLRSASSWGIVAPGGDPVTNDPDALHWIENIWTTTPLDSSFAGLCTTDPFGGSNDCRIDIAGTSMATPHVAGAAALILSINRKYASPSAMKQLLCSTADDIGDPHQGCGRLNVYRAAAVAAGDPVLP